MQTTIKALGNDLDSQASTARFIEPLNRLAAYCEHQQDLLKGFEKGPKKLEENLKIIGGWIHDVKDLARILAS